MYVCVCVPPPPDSRSDTDHFTVELGTWVRVCPWLALLKAAHLPPHLPLAVNRETKTNYEHSQPQPLDISFKISIKESSFAQRDTSLSICALTLPLHSEVARWLLLQLKSPANFPRWEHLSRHLTPITSPRRLLFVLFLQLSRRWGICSAWVCAWLCDLLSPLSISRVSSQQRAAAGLWGLYQR